MLSRVFAWLAAYFGGGIARLLTGAGLSVVTFAGLSLAVSTALNVVIAYFGDLPGAMAQIILLSGFGNVINMIGSAILTRLALSSGALSLRKVA